MHEDPASHQVYHSVHVAGLSPSLMHLKPNKACLEFVDAMLQVSKSHPASVLTASCSSALECFLNDR